MQNNAHFSPFPSASFVVMENIYGIAAARIASVQDHGIYCNKKDSLLIFLSCVINVYALSFII